MMPTIIPMRLKMSTPLLGVSWERSSTPMEASERRQYYDLFELGIDECGNIFVKYKVLTIDDDDASNKTMTTSFKTLLSKLLRS
jgi:hypothetical protein